LVADDAQDRRSTLRDDADPPGPDRPQSRRTPQGDLCRYRCSTNAVGAEDANPGLVGKRSEFFEPFAVLTASLAVAAGRNYGKLHALLGASLDRADDSPQWHGDKGRVDRPLNLLNGRHARHPVNARVLGIDRMDPPGKVQICQRGERIVRHPERFACTDDGHRFDVGKEIEHGHGSLRYDSLHGGQGFQLLIS
jgi:hypothetical protein